ncbi:hypothetical protein BP6252_07401 [Coleophoma cylindrospora]|uniref:Uncharacterized protein n=1 Tax=Coleophoma cylindrospora TaxID=1849047 RepID=A0A3D8RHX7_9HELO|nr:hypothetical protein BP6252_07401 [Coleophoma cylindrospora]
MLRLPVAKIAQDKPNEVRATECSPTRKPDSPANAHNSILYGLADCGAVFYIWVSGLARRCQLRLCIRTSMVPTILVFSERASEGRIIVQGILPDLLGFTPPPPPPLTIGDRCAGQAAMEVLQLCNRSVSRMTGGMNAPMRSLQASLGSAGSGKGFERSEDFLGSTCILK